MSKEKTVVVVHGCHPDAEGWEDIMWGDPQNGVWGRIPLALKLWNEYGESAWLHWAGRLEGEKTLQLAKIKAKELDYFKSCTQDEIEELLSERSVLNASVENTREELESAFRVEGANRLVLVSSPTHIARCLQEATKIRLQKYPHVDVFAVSSDVSYHNCGPEDVVVMEPPHRADDRSAVPFNQLAKRLMQFYKRPDIAGEVFDEVNKVIDKYED
jgi:hypothetical protein